MAASQNHAGKPEGERRAVDHSLPGMLGSKYYRLTWVAGQRRRDVIRSSFVDPVRKDDLAAGKRLAYRRSEVHRIPRWSRIQPVKHRPLKRIVRNMVTDSAFRGMPKLSRACLETDIRHIESETPCLGYPYINLPLILLQKEIMSWKHKRLNLIPDEHRGFEPIVCLFQHESPLPYDGQKISVYPPTTLRP